MASCYRHKDRETGVSCGHCGRPLCPDCVRHGPTGVRCRDCLRLPRTAMGVATSRQLLRAAVCALLVAVPGGLLFGWLHLGGLWPAALLGLLIGSAALAGSRHHRDLPVQIVAALMAMLSMLIATLLPIASSVRHLAIGPLLALLSSPRGVVLFLATGVAAVARFRF